MLPYFLENQGIALSREKILNNVWNYDYFGDARTIDTHVKKLRSKMGEKGDLIKTIWGMGYKLSEDDDKCKPEFKFICDAGFILRMSGHE